MTSVPRVYVDKLVSVSAEPQTGIVKITLGVDAGGEKPDPAVTLVVSAGHLREIFGTVGQTMQKTFGEGGPRGPRRGPPPPGGGRPDDRGPAPDPRFADITK